MTDKWLITDMFTGQPVQLPIRYPGEPSSWFIEGWNDGMEYSRAVNPYAPGTSEWLDWQDGYELAKAD